MAILASTKSLAAFGRWPWPRSMLARVVRALADNGAKVIALDIILSEPEVSDELRLATRMSERLGALGASPSSPMGQALRQELAGFTQAADSDGQLAGALRESGRAVLAIVFDLKAGVPSSAPEPSGVPYKSAMTRFRQYGERGRYPPPQAERAGPPIRPFEDAAQALGTSPWSRRGRHHALGSARLRVSRLVPSLAQRSGGWLARGVEPAGFLLDFGGLSPSARSRFRWILATGC